jgi:hypothetical protein
MEVLMSMNKSRTVTALYPVLGVENPQETAAAMQGLFGLQPVFEADWYVHLRDGDTEVQVGFVRFDHVSVPDNDRRPVSGTSNFITMDAPDVAALWHELKPRLQDVIVPLQDEPWGQRHFICRLPGGVMVDVVQQLSAGG